jgi:hypothetical protein
LLLQQKAKVDKNILFLSLRFLAATSMLHHLETDVSAAALALLYLRVDEQVIPFEQESSIKCRLSSFLGGVATWLTALIQLR